MTTGELLNNSSSVTNVGAWEHLENLNAGGIKYIKEFDVFVNNKEVRAEYQAEDIVASCTNLDVAKIEVTDISVETKDKTYVN